MDPASMPDASGSPRPRLPAPSRRRKLRSAGILLAVFAVGLLVGVYVQHRWPLGRLRDEASRDELRAKVSAAELAQLPRERRLVLVCAGQSNAANYGTTRGAGGAGVYAFHAGELFVGKDPLPGGDGYGGSVWTRLAARLASTGRYDAIILAVTAQGSSYARDWAPGGGLHPRLVQTLVDLRGAGLEPDAILWAQGEQEAREPGSSGADYAEQVRAIAAECRRQAPRAPFFVSIATHGGETNAQIPLAQRQLASEPGFAAGPDLDQLGASYRRDGIHWNERGLLAAADLWFKTLEARLTSSTSP